MSADTSIRATLADAIKGRTSVRMVYQGLERLCAPHILGRNVDDEPHVLVFQFGGGSHSGLPEGGAWRCMRLGEIAEVSPIDDPWCTVPTEGNPPPKCVTHVELQVALP
ncbi:MAG: hypothetical protein ACE366_11110 [Bradymonadia bacterium]